MTTHETAFPNSLPIVSIDDVTIDSLKAEAAALGDRFSEVTAHTADLVADAEEMLQAQSDLKDLLARGFPVSAGLFERVRLLHETLAPLAAESARHVELGKALTDEAEAARVRLLDIRAQLAALGKAAGLPPWRRRERRPSRCRSVGWPTRGRHAPSTTVRSALEPRVAAEKKSREHAGHRARPTRSSRGP